MSVFFTFGTAVKLALDSIRAHKLRSFLTLLGVIIGVASVILVGAAIDGLGAFANGITAKAFGTDSFLVAQVASVGNMSKKQYLDKLRKNKRVRTDDVTYLRDVAGDSVLYSPYQQRFEDVKGENRTFEAANVIGASATLPDIRDIPVGDGRYYTDTEERMRQQVAVIGADVKDQLFPGGSALGKKVRISGIDFLIVGVLDRLGSSFGRSLDTPIYIPSTTYQSMFGGRNTGMAVFGRAREGAGVSNEDALETTRTALRSRYHAAPGKDDNFDTLTPDSMRSFIDQILGVIAAVVVPVTSISLVVGGIVIMNIMLVSVTERTREIGVRKSLGARQADIMLQFLTESVILSMVGGILGVALGAGSAIGLSAITGTTLKVTLPYIVLSLFVSSAVGVISGWYPARRAARLDPVVALRAE